METFSTSLKIIPKASAVEKFSEAMRAAAQKRAQTVKVLPKGVLPLVTSTLPSVSVVPKGLLVSANPPITFPRYWGRLPSRKWPRTGLPTRHIRAIRPVEISTLGFLTRTFFFWAQAPLAIAAIADDIRQQSETEKAEEDRVNSELLELKMRYELDELTEDQYKIRESRLNGRLKDIREGRVKTVAENLPQKRKKKKPKGGEKKGKT